MCLSKNTPLATNLDGIEKWWLIEDPKLPRRYFLNLEDKKAQWDKPKKEEVLDEEIKHVENLVGHLPPVDIKLVDKADHLKYI